MSSSASSSPLPTGSHTNNAPTPGANAAPSIGRDQIIAICVVLGLVSASSIILLILACRKRELRTRRLRFKRNATPLPDAEFDNWRRPAKDSALYHSGGSTIYKSTGLRYDGLKSPAPLVHAFRVPSSTNVPTTSTRPKTPPRSAQTFSVPDTSPAPSAKPLIRPTTASTVDTRRSRHKSSVSLHDRPPTPYSPSSPPSTWDNETLWQEEAPMSPREKRHKVHLSDTSDFTFDFGYGPPDSPRREPVRRESWVHHSRRFSSLGSVAHPNYPDFQFDIEQGKKLDF